MVPPMYKHHDNGSVLSCGAGDLVKNLLRLLPRPKPTLVIDLDDPQSIMRRMFDSLVWSKVRQSRIEVRSTARKQADHHHQQKYFLYKSHLALREVSHALSLY